MELERELELEDFKRNWNLKKKELELNHNELQGIEAELELNERD